MFHAAGCPSVDSGTSHCFWPFILTTFFYRRRQSKPSVSKGLHFFTFHFANKQGASAVFSTLNSGESTIFFFKWSETMNNLENVTLCIPAFVCCSATPSDHISVSHWHHRFSTLFISRWTTCLLLIFQMASSQEPPLPPPLPPPQVRICLQSLQADRVRANGH